MAGRGGAPQGLETTAKHHLPTRTSPPPPLRSRPSQTSLPAPPEPHSAPPFPPPRRPTPPADRERSLWYCGEPRDSLRRLDGHTLKTDAKNCSLRLRGSTERTVGAACAGRAGGERGGSGGGGTARVRRRGSKDERHGAEGEASTHCAVGAQRSASRAPPAREGRGRGWGRGWGWGWRGKL